MRNSKQHGERRLARVDTGRQGAVILLDAVLGDQCMMFDALARPDIQTLPAPDRAQAQRLANEVLRGLERADRLLEEHLRRSPPLTVLNTLRLGVVELCSGAAAHGVVNSLVDLIAAHPKHRRLKGLVNAVLRKMAGVAPTAWPKMRMPRLPGSLRDPLVEVWTAETVAAMEAAHFQGAAVDLTLKPGAGLSGEVPARPLPTGSYRLEGGAQISALAGFDTGDWWVQDAAAAMPARLLAVKPGEQVLDLCAAPGGKTMQLSSMGADVTAVDVSGARLRRLRENLTRTNLMATVLEVDLFTVAETYDAVLLDAPCSATGTIRRHPDLPFAKSEMTFADLVALQRRMLDHAWALVRPGGRLVYCTCSLLPEEGETQAEAALQRLPDVSVDTKQRDALPGVEASWHSPEGGLRLRPDFWADWGGLDGFYMIRLNKAV